MGVGAAPAGGAVVVVGISCAPSTILILWPLLMAELIAPASAVGTATRTDLLNAPLGIFTGVSVILSTVPSPEMSWPSSYSDTLAPGTMPSSRVVPAFTVTGRVFG